MTKVPTSSFEDITPAMAQEYLTKNVVNRSISQNHVIKLAMDMEAGKFLVTDAGIGFDTRGNLINGQHRLNAVILADKTVRMLVVRDLPPKSMGVMDVDVRRRSLANVLEIDGGIEKWGVPAQVIQTVATAMYRGPHERRAPSTQTLREFANKYVDSISWACHQFTTPGRGVSKSAVVAVVARAYHHGKSRGLVTQISRFAEVLNTGLTDGSAAEAAVIKLRDGLLKFDGRGSGHAVSVEMYRRVASALDAHLRGRKTGQVDAFRIAEDAGAEDAGAEDSEQEARA